MGGLSALGKRVSSSHLHSAYSVADELPLAPATESQQEYQPNFWQVRLQADAYTLRRYCTAAAISSTGFSDCRRAIVK